RSGATWPSEARGKRAATNEAARESNHFLFNGQISSSLRKPALCPSGGAVTVIRYVHRVSFHTRLKEAGNRDQGIIESRKCEWRQPCSLSYCTCTGSGSRTTPPAWSDTVTATPWER